MVGQQASRSSWLCLLLMAFQVWALGIEVRSSWLHDKLFMNRLVSPILELAFLTCFLRVSLSGEFILGTSDFRYYHSSWWFSSDGQFCIREPLGMSGGILGDCSSLGDGTSLWWVGARDVAKHPWPHTEWALITKTHAAPNMRSMAVDGI